jgi:hypothetical protein
MKSSRNANDPITGLPLPLLLSCLPPAQPDGWVIDANGKHPVQLVPESILDDFLNPTEDMRWQSLGHHGRRYVETLQNSIEAGEELMRARRARSTVEQLPMFDALPVSLEGQSKATKLVLEFFRSVNTGIAHSNVRVWWSRREGKPVLGIHCGQDLLRALYLTAFARLGQPGGIARCPNCGRWFKRGYKKEKKFCTTNCRSASTMRNWRKKQGKHAQKSAEKGANDGTRKTR